MKAKEFVKKHYPKATCERQVAGRVARIPYYLIRPTRGAMYIADGKTESNAWVKAKKAIEASVIKNEKAYQQLLATTQTKITELEKSVLEGEMLNEDFIKQLHTVLANYVLLCEANGWTERKEYPALKSRHRFGLQFKA